MTLGTLINKFTTYPASLVYKEEEEGESLEISLPGEFEDRLKMYNMIDRKVLLWAFDNTLVGGRLYVVLEKKEEQGGNC